MRFVLHCALANTQWNGHRYIFMCNERNMVTARVKRCIFCGTPFSGQKRNFEHIIPAWLVEEADLRKRDMSVQLPGISRKVSMSRIGLKVCKTCNDADSRLEAQAKIAYLAIKAGEDLADDQVRSLLDWLDKVRVGLWLWLIEQLGDQAGAEPKFRVNGRMAHKDRIVLVRRYPEGPPMKGLGLFGLGEFFMGIPSAIGLLINNIFLISISSDFLVLRHIRNVRVLQTHSAGDLTGFELVANAPDQPRMALLGEPSIFAQCVMPDEDFQMFGVPIQNSSPHVSGWSESTILRLDDGLREDQSPSASVPVFIGNIAANTTLMERNVFQAAEYLVRDFLRANDSEIDTEAAATNSKDGRRALDEIRGHRSEIDAEYRALTGLQLPK